jgi:hypothetical protein
MFNDITLQSRIFISTPWSKEMQTTEKDINEVGTDGTFLYL